MCAHALVPLKEIVKYHGQEHSALHLIGQNQSHLALTSPLFFY